MSVSRFRFGNGVAIHGLTASACRAASVRSRSWSRGATSFALVAALTAACVGNHPVACSCLEVQVTSGANNTPITDAQIWVIDAVHGDRRLPATNVSNRVAISDEACSTTPHEFEVRRAGYVSQRFTHRSSVERLGCDPAPPPEPVVLIRLVQQ